MTLWRPGREDVRPALLIALLPVAIALPQLLGWLVSDPAFYTGYMNSHSVRGLLRGVPMIDPNNGFQTQALGFRAAHDWLQGRVPWWNPYSGVGLPLAAEYQPAAFFPLTFLLLLPHGILWEQLLLQALAGFGTYALLRQIGLAPLAATMGGLLFAFNGTMAWFSHAPSQPLAFLPWILFGIERAAAKSCLGLPGGWRTLALSMALSLLAGFPETAYIDGLLALAWTIVRGARIPAQARAPFAARIALGGGIGVACAAPQILAFVQYLPHAFLGEHDKFARAALPPHAAIPSLVAPYAFGPIFGYLDQWFVLSYIWGGIGGYASIVLIAMAVYGAIARRDALAGLLIAWCALALGKTFLIEPAVWLWNLVPGVTISAFARYAQPTWELAFVVLAARGVDDLAASRVPRRAAWWAAAAVVAIALAASAQFLARLWPQLEPHRGIVRSLLASAAWAFIGTFACLTLVRRRAPAALAALLVFDSALLFFVPTLSAPRAAELDTAAIEFLRRNLGLQRFYTLGPIRPNYGAYFGIASINHNYLPVSERWVAWVRTHLDRGADPIAFTGDFARAADLPSASEELRRNLAEFQWLGVKYVVTIAQDEPFAGRADVARVYRDGLLAIFELPQPKPYFEASDGRCRVEATARESATVDCPVASTIVRRELFFPGWTATLNGAPVEIAEHRSLFQSVEVPAGRAELRFDYEPPHIGWAWLASLLALGALLHHPRRRTP